MKCERCRKSMHGVDPDEAYCDSCREIVLAEEAGEDDGSGGECVCCGSPVQAANYYCERCDNMECPDCNEDYPGNQMQTDDA